MKKTIYSLLFLVTGIGFFACIKKNDSLPIRYSPIPSGNTNVKFLMLSPDAPTLNFFVNDQKASAVAPSSTGVVQGFVFPSIYPSTVGYTTLPSGSVKVDAKVTEASTTLPGQVISTTNNTFEAGKFYTYVLLDSMSHITTVAVEDDPTVADTSKAYFRIGNFTSNSPSVKIDMIKTSSGTPFSQTFANVPFKSVSAFSTLEAGAGQVYKIYLKDPITDAKLDSISAFTPAKTKKYTIYTRGVMGLPVSNAKRPIITSYTNF